MERSTKTKIQCYRDALGLMVNGYIPDKLIEDYCNEVDDAFEPLRDFVLNNMRGEILDWSTAIGIIEAADCLYDCAYENGNLYNPLVVNRSGVISKTNFVKLNCNRFTPDLKPDKVIKPKKVYQYKRKATGEGVLFDEIWKERPHKSQISGDPIHEPAPINFMHVLAKGQNKYPKFKLLKENIVLVTDEEHFQFDNARHEIVDDKDWIWIFLLEAELKKRYKRENQ